MEPGTNPGFLHQQNTLRDALVASVHFDAFHRHADRLVMANIAQTVNVLQAMLLTDGEHLVRTPTYHVFEMNRGHHDAAALDVHVVEQDTERQVGDARLDTLSLSASVKDGAVLISVSNLDAERDLAVDVDLRGGGIGPVSARLLTADALHRHNTAGEPDAVAPRPFDGVKAIDAGLRVELPAHSFATISAPLAR